MSGAVFPDRHVKQVGGNPGVSREGAGLRDHPRLDGIDNERQRQRDVLQHGEGLDQDPPRRDHADTIE